MVVLLVVVLIILLFFLFLNKIIILIIDLNECTLGTHDCHAQATCTNTIGSFTCACKTGYSGNGVTCTGTFFFYHFLLFIF